MIASHYVFSFLLCFFLFFFPRGKVKEDNETNFLRDLESSFMDSAGGYLLPPLLGIFGIVPHQYQFLLAEIELVFMVCQCAVSSVLDGFQSTATHVPYLCNLQVSLCRFKTQ